MKIDMHLFSLIVALAASVTDGRISSSSSSSSSSSQPVGGSAVDMTPNRRDLQPALGTHYCTVTEDGTQRGVVDWQGIDQCHKCEGGQLYWPCGTNNANLCTGFCTPEAVCDERLRAAAAAAETPTAAASDCTAELKEAEKLFLQEQDAAVMTSKQATSDCVAVNAEKVAVLEEQKLEKDIKIASLTGTIESLDEIVVLKDAELAGFGDTISKMNTIIEEKDVDYKDLVATKDEAFKKLVEKDVEIESLRTKVEDLKASLASTTSPTTSPTDLPNTKSPTKSPTCGKCSGCLKPSSGDCNNDDYEQASCKQIGLVWCGVPSDFSSELASDKIQQEIEEEKMKEEFEKDEATNFDYASFYNTIKNRPIDDTAISFPSTAKCSDSGSSAQYGGDCSRTPTYCPSTVGDLEGRKARLLGEIEMIESDIKQIDSEKDYLEQFQEKGLDSKNNSVNCRCETSPSSSQLSWKQVCSGGCSGTDSCLNLDFVCSPSAPICELNCSGRNSCNGLTMYCGDNQACAIKCSPYFTSCVGAKVVYNGMEFNKFGEEQEWKSPPAEDIRYFRFN